MPSLVRAKVKYRIRKNNAVSTHTWELNLSNIFAGRTESALLEKLRKKHPQGDIIITDILWR